MTWIIKKVNRIPMHCGVAYESVCSIAIGQAKGNLHVQHKVKKLEKLKTRHQGTEIWNSTPTNIQECKTIKSFSIKFRKFTLQSYSHL